MPYATQKRNVVELEVFRGYWGADATVKGSGLFFGFSQTQGKERTDNTAWSGLPSETLWVDGGGRTVQDGDVYERQVLYAEDGSVQSEGAWSYVGEMRTVAGRQAMSDGYSFTVPGRDSYTSPGQPMRNGLGLVMWDGAAGSAIDRPNSGEQDIDPVTGELLFEADGTTPVLVP